MRTHLYSTESVCAQTQTWLASCLFAGGRKPQKQQAAGATGDPGLFHLPEEKVLAAKEDGAAKLDWSVETREEPRIVAPRVGSEWHREAKRGPRRNFPSGVARKAGGFPFFHFTACVQRVQTKTLATPRDSLATGGCQSGFCFLFDQNARAWVHSPPRYLLGMAEQRTQTCAIIWAVAPPKRKPPTFTHSRPFPFAARSDGAMWPGAFRMSGVAASVQRS